MSWFAAKKHCEGIGGKLVEIDSEEENTALVEEINRRRGDSKPVKSFWIGLTDLEKEADWRLASSGLKPSYLNWYKDQPNNKWGNEDCARIRIGLDPHWKDTWSDVNCNLVAQNPSSSLTMQALCEFDPLKQSTSTGRPSTENTSTEGASYEP